LSNKFDVFTVSETWLDSKITDLEIEIPGYNIYRVDRENKTGGGVCIYVRQIYKTICLRDISSISASGFHQLWLKVQVRHLKSIIINTVYRPPNTPTSCFDSDLAANFVYASSLGAPIHILGDLNCNLLKREASDCKVLGNFCSSYNLTQLIREPTRVTEHTSSLLDIILVSDTKQVRESFVMHSSVSDHDLVYLTLRLKKPRTKPVYINIRSFKHYNREAFYNDISQAPWSVIDVFTDIDDKVNAFNTMFNDILNQHAPIKSIKVKGKPNPCVNENIRALMNTRDHWRKLAQRSNDPFTVN
jgi:exonuclease III